MLLEQKTIRALWFQMLLTLLGSCVLLFIVAPLLSMIISTPLSDLKTTALDSEVIESIKLTIIAAFFATIISTFAGVPLAYLLAHKKFPGHSLLLAIIDLPIIIPHSVAGIALFAVIGRQSLIGRLFGGGLVGTVAGISVAMAFVSVPFLVNSARHAFAAIDPRLEKAARTLHASPLRVFFTISLPLSWKGIISGMILMWGRGISEFGAVVIIAYHPMTTPVMVYQRYNDFGLESARPVAVLLILIYISIFLSVRLFSLRLKPRELADA